MSAFSYQSEPQIQYLYQLVRAIADGNLQVPRFQRPVVWTAEQRLELFRSVLTGTPIGTIMLWRTVTVQMQSYDSIGPYELKPPSGSVRQYIVDGHQRLATLFGALHVPPDGHDLAEEISYFDLESEDFLFAGSDDEPSPLWMPLRFVLDFASLLPFQRSLMQRPDAEKLIRRADRVVAAFSQYKIPVVTIVTDDLDQIAKTFQRINSQGTPMGEAHMISALTWSPDFDLNELIRDFTENYLAPAGWGDLGEDAILRACKLALGLPASDPKRDVDRLSKQIRAVPTVFDQVHSAMVTAIFFLRDFCGISSPRLMPYPSHIVPLTEAFRRDPARKEETRRADLLRWFWAMEYARRLPKPERLPDLLDAPEWDQGSLPSPLRRARLDPLPPAFHARDGRCRLLALRMAERIGPDASKWLGAHGLDAVPHLLYGYMKVPQDLFDSPANRIVAEPKQAPEERRRIRAACVAKTPSAEDLDLLDRHVIPKEARGALAANDLPRFFAMRLEALNRLENDFAQRIGLLSP